MNRSFVSTALFIALGTFLSFRPAIGQDPSSSWRFERSSTDVGAANEFIFNSGSTGRRSGKRIHIKEFRLQARLLTPLNSSFNKPGDVVVAQVIVPPEGELARVLCRGTILEGAVARARPAHPFQLEGKLNVNFYRAYIGNKTLILDVAADSDQSIVSGLSSQLLTRKQFVREALITATRISVPAAIGTGGLSLAITTGAGATIGCILADDKRYFRGAMYGAWNGSGLAMFNPIVKKGPEAIIPTGTFIELSLSNPVDLTIPADVLRQLNTPKEQSRTGAVYASYFLAEPEARHYLHTSAQILAHKSASSNHYSNHTDSPDRRRTEEQVASSLEKVNIHLRQRDLAAAFAASEKELAAHPFDQNVRQLHQKLLGLVSGASEAASPR